ncbi:MAG: hypothetical protein HZA62_05730 [Rhodocyclales bacterium]|nr:hypothetical protein [Rhodocyclales bacterium]
MNKKQMQPLNIRSRADRLNGIVHFMFTFAMIAIVVLGIERDSRLLDFMCSAFAPSCDFAFRHVSLIDAVSHRRLGDSFVVPFLALTYLMTFATYLHGVAWHLYRERSNRKISIEESGLANYKFYCNSINKDFNPIANPFCLLIEFASKGASAPVRVGSVMDGFRYYASRPEVWVGYVALGTFFFYYLPKSDRLMSGHFFLPVGFPIAYYLLAVAQVSILFEIAVLLFAVASNWFGHKE